LHDVAVAQINAGPEHARRLALEIPSTKFRVTDAGAPTETGASNRREQS
jgi:hypothetical protein